MSRNELLYEKEFVDDLVKNQKYVKLDIKNEEKIFELIFENIGRLNNIELTQQNILDIRRELLSNNSASSYRFAQYLWGFDTVKIYKNDGPKKIRLKFVDWENWANNEFYVLQQFPTRDAKNNMGKRFDSLILINGFPLILFEFKDKSENINKAINQIDESYRGSVLNKGIFRFIQILIGSNFEEVKFLANNKRTNNNKILSFKWTSENGGSSKELIKDFLNKNALEEYLKNYVVFQRSKDDEKIILLRPYQQRAIKKAINFVEKQLKTNLDAKHNLNNAYIWHTTGSGKTLTSYKIAEILSKNADIDHVVFLVDRNDLNDQTSQTFQKLMSSSKNEKIDFLNQDTSKDLYEIFLKKEKLIITTIQKLNNVLSSYKNEKIEFLTNKKFVFIIDECHRSNAGLMGKRIKDFLNNSIMIGFSGTPIFEENNDRETQKIFGNEIDSYNMKDAILDKNVLGFKVVNYYQETPIFRENNNSNLGKIKSIINVIKSKHLDFTNNRNYNSIIAFDTIQDALTFYDEFYKMDVGDIFATPIFSSYSNEEKNEKFFNLKEHKEKILKRYEEKFNTSFKVEDFDKYVNDVQWRFKEYNSENDSIDIVIVVDMLLTGFDSPRTNTLYINKELKNHNLIQAFSRTNRLSDYLKKRGIIVNFSLEEQSINDAFKIYANSSDKEIQQLVYGEKYEQVVEDFINFWNSLKSSFSNIYDEKNNEIFRNISLENKKKYLKNLSQVSNIFSSLKTFKEYGKNEKISDFSLEQLNQYQKWANEIKKNLSTNEKEKISYEVLNSIDISNIKFAYKEMIIDEIYLENLLFFNKKISKYPNNRLTYEDTLSEINKHIQLIKNNYNQGKINQKEYEIFLLLVQKWKNEIKNFFIKKDKSLDEKEFIDYGKRILKSVFQKVKNQIEAMWLEKILKEYHGINNDQIRKDWKKRINDKDLDDIEKSEFIKKWSRRSKEVDKDIIDKLSIEYKESIEAFLDFEIKMNKIIESKI